MRKSDYYILKTSSPDTRENDSSESSNSLLDLDNNEFNFMSHVVPTPANKTLDIPVIS